MPRNAQGFYTLPAGNPVVPNTLIETSWANPTMSDIADALTGSLPRDGSAPMTGPLTLQAAAPTQPRHAVSKGYMEQFLAYATGMPIGAITAIAGSTVPAGYLLCDGQAVSRTTYADLFTAIGTIYGSGDEATTFNVPDLRDWFIRGRADARAIGSTQAAAFANHAHSLSDPGHTHTASQPAHDHTITTGGHSHGVNDPGHFHQATFYAHNDNGPLLGNANGGAAGTMTTDTRGTGISIAAVGNLGGSADSRQPAVTVAASVTGASIGATGDAETRPQNVAMNYIIKAVNDAAAATAAGTSYSPGGGISAATVQGAIQELDNEKVSLAALDAQVWQSPVRIAGTDYTNTTPLPIQVSIICTSPSAGTSVMGLFCDGIQIAKSYATFNANEAMLQATIPPGSTYVVNGIAGPVSTLAWNELR